MEAITILRTVGGALLVGGVVFAIFSVWFGWPAFVGVALGALFAAVWVTVSASLGRDSSDADDAWRRGAPDLASPRSAGEPPRDGAEDTR